MGIETSIGAAIAGSFLTEGTLAYTITAAAINVAVAAAVSTAATALATNGQQGPDKATRTANVREPLAPREWVYGSVRKGGVVFYLNGSGPANWRLHMLIAIAAHECEEITELWINGELTALDDVLPSSGNPPFHQFSQIDELGDEYAMKVPGAGQARRLYSSFNWRLGTDDQEAIPLLDYENENWTSAHRARGVCYLYARLVHDESGTAWPSFIPKLTVRVKGRKCYDPRSGLTEWTDNPALMAADILENLLGVPRERIDATAWEAAADVCDEAVSLKAGGTEKRYRAAGFFQLEGEPEDFLEPVARAMAGAVVEHHGTYYIHAGAYLAPEAGATITDDDLTGRVSVRTADSDRERANVARGLFASPESHDQLTEFPQVVDSAAVAADGAEHAMDLDLEWVPSHSQAQRVAKIALQTQRFGRTVELALNLRKGLDFKPWDSVVLDLAIFGVSGTFRVVEHRTEIVGDGDAPVMVPTLVLREIGESIFAWDETTEEGDLEVETALVPAATSSRS